MSAGGLVEELDFTLMFEADGGAAAGQSLEVRTSAPSTHVAAALPLSQELQLQTPCFSTTSTLNQDVGFQPLGGLGAFECPSIQITSIAPNNQMEAGGQLEVGAARGAEGGFPEASWSRDQLYLPLDPCYRDPALCPSPGSSLSSRSWMSDVSSCESFAQVYDDLEGELRTAARVALGSPSESPMGSPGCGGGAFGVELWQQKYQHPAAYSPSFSPFQSPRQSPCHSPRTSVTEDTWLNRRPASRPSSRPTSPCGKRRHCSADRQARSPSPHHSYSPTPGASPRGSVTDETWVGSPGGATGPLLMTGYQELDVPSKTRKTSGGQLGFLVGHSDPACEPFLGSPTEEGQEQDDLADLFLQVPSHFSWTKPKPGNPPMFRASSPPPLDWPLPSRHEQCELKLEVQPKAYHRAHYETEGSRGAIKAAGGGHPVVTLGGFGERPLSLLLFIGTADDRYLRPHSFYQVHRVTGKTVTTACQEKVVGCTKVLEIPLHPESNMSCSVDCAGILKLRNADIELKKGETDIGRKNTRVRVVFRVAIPRPDGRELWLQTASVPVECSQRSGQDLPQVDGVSLCRGSADGGEEMTITGSNISPQSRVVFVEKGSDGRALWEADAKVLAGKSSGAGIVVETPRFGKNTKFPVQVHFYVTNGKRRRSVPQTFTYLPPVAPRTPSVSRIKQEPWELDRFSYGPPAFFPASFQSPSLQTDCNSRHLPAEGILSSQSAPHLHQPPSSYVPQQTSSLFPHSSSVPSRISSISSQSLMPLHTPNPQTSVLPPQATVLPPQAPVLPPQTSVLPPQTTVLPPQTSVLPPQTSVLPPQTSVLPPQTTVLPPQNSLEALNIKQEPVEQPDLGPPDLGPPDLGPPDLGPPDLGPPDLGPPGLQEITLDDVNEIIDRDIGGRGEPYRPDQYQYRDPESGEAALPPCGGPQ